jgi:hypothetical protein
MADEAFVQDQVDGAAVEDPALRHPLDPGAIRDGEDRWKFAGHLRSLSPLDSRMGPLRIHLTSPLVRTPIAIDRRRQVPLHRQIYDEWRRGILSGRFAAGDGPDARTGGGPAGVTRHGDRRLRSLVAEGYLDAARGSGTFVAELPERLARPPIGGHQRPGVSPRRTACRGAIARLPRLASSTCPPGPLRLFPFGVWGRWCGAPPPGSACSATPTTLPDTSCPRNGGVVPARSRAVRACHNRS